MKKFCTPRNLKLLSYFFVLLYCIKISLLGSTSIMIIKRLFFGTLLFSLFYLIDLDIFKKNIYRDTIKSIIATVVFMLIDFFIDPEGFNWWLYIVIVLLIAQCILFAIKRQFSTKLLFERFAQVFLFYIIISGWWLLIVKFLFDHNNKNDIMFDGLEIMILSGIGFLYFWIVDTFTKSKNN